MRRRARRLRVLWIAAAHLNGVRVLSDATSRSQANTATAGFVSRAKAKSDDWPRSPRDGRRRDLIACLRGFRRRGALSKVANDVVWEIRRSLTPSQKPTV